MAPRAAGAQSAFVSAVRQLAGIALAPDSRVPRSPIAPRKAAIAQMRAALDEWDGALTALESRVARELPEASRERAFQLHLELGMAYRQRGRLQEALQQFDAAAAVRPGASDVHLLRALTLEAAGQREPAGEALLTAWRRDPDSAVKAYLVLRRTREVPNTDRQRAENVLRNALRRILSGDTRPGDASFPVLDLLPDTLSTTPLVGDAELAAVFALLAEGDFDSAVSTPAGSPAPSRADDDSPRAHFVRGRTGETEGRLAEARRAYTIALSGTLAGRHVLYAGIGRLAQVDGELDAAIEAFDQAVRLNPNTPITHRELADAYSAAGRVDDAFAELMAALLVDPADADALAAIGQLFLDDDRAGDALPVLSRAVELKPDRLQTHYALAMALSRTGRAAEAARQFEQFHRLSRQSLETRRRQVTGQAGPSEAAR